MRNLIHGDHVRYESGSRFGSRRSVRFVKFFALAIASKPGGSCQTRALATLLIFALQAPLAATAAEPSYRPAEEMAQANAAGGEARHYLLVFRNKTVPEVAEVVLGEILRLPYGVDPLVTGEMTLEIDALLTRTQLLAEFEAAVRRAGVVTTHLGGELLLLPPPPAAPSLPSPPSEPVMSAAAASPPRSTALLLALLVAAGAVGGALVHFRASAGRYVGVSASRQARRRKRVVQRLRNAASGGPAEWAAAEELALRETIPLEHALVRLGIISEDELAAAYGSVAGCLVWRPEASPALAWDGGEPPGWARPRAGVAVLEVTARRLVIAAADPLDDAGFAALSAESGRALSILVARLSDVAPFACAAPRSLPSTVAGSHPGVSASALAAHSM